jgi:hypothetical protein
MVRRDLRQELEPEHGHLVQHLALVGNPGPEHVVEGGDPVGGDDQQVVAEVVHVAHLSAPGEGKGGEVGCQQR